MPGIDNAATALDQPGADAAVRELRRVLGESAGSRHDRLRGAIAAADDNLYQRFRAGAPVGELVRARAAVVDALLLSQWHEQPQTAGNGAALVAAGGFGRGELHPKSDVDIMVLLPDEAPPPDWLSDFLTALWDSGLEIGHSVRTVADCEREARDDITVTTTLMEARLLAGPEGLFEAMQNSIGPARLWNSRAFFKAKVAEQSTRHRRYDDTAYKLEPNVKGSPGGLRDIQMIGWVANRHFGSRSLKDLVAHEFLTEGQLRLLIDGRDYLWRIRFALHMLTGRAEDRLLFDHQKQLAQILGYEDARYTLAVEQMMQRYYRTVMNLSRLNEILLQLFEEAILLDSNAEPVVVNERFKLRNGFLQTRGDDVFRRHPSALLEVFLLLQQNPDIRGVSAWTVGLIKRSLDLIDDEFRQSPRNHRLFLKILEAPEGVTHELRRMNRYGVLGLYIPAFGRIVGRMQFDLFHAYTVDEHTLFVVSNLRRFALTRFDDELPHCSAVMRRIDKPLLAYLSGLFHDIAKGRGGDHSKLGATDARSFCLEHGLDEADADLVAWLVRHHLLLSMTAQKKDLSDPAVIRKFAAVVGDQRRLDYLYVLTVADVRGTNPRLWNSWKASLFQELYGRTRDALVRGVENTPESEELIAEGRAEARAILESDRALDAAAIERVW
ncbi:MAG: [protein-PII] uridylyltransferase, partial [Pseudomonadota bacterium]